MMHEDVLGLPIEKAQEILKKRGIAQTEVVFTCAPKAPQHEGFARVVAILQDGCVLVAARFLDGVAKA